MKYGFVMPAEDPRAAVDFAQEAERAGWDGFFLSEGMWSTDAWICLTGAAMCTERIRLGTLLTPLSIMRPWKLASQAATLDQLSQGRVIITVGMGAPDVGFAEFGEETDLRTRAELVDEGLDIVYNLWRGQPFTHRGKHYTVDATALRFHVPAPVQQPHIPIWVVGAWPRPRSMRRVLRCDGLVPAVKPRGEAGRSPTPAEVGEMAAWIQAERGEGTPFDIVIEGESPADAEAAQETVRPWIEAGATWWIESIWDDPEKRVRRLRQGPPSRSG